MTHAVGPRHRAATTSSGRRAAPRRRSRRWRDTYAAAVREHGHHLRGALAPPGPASQGTIERAAPDARRGHRQLPGAAPVPARHRAPVARGCEPVAIEMERSLPLVSDAFEVGTPVQAQGAARSTATRENVFASLDDLAANPNTLLGADATCGARSRWPRRSCEYVAPYQTVCNYWNYYWTGDLRARVRERARRHRPAQHLQVGQQHPGQPPELHRGRPAGRRARGRGPQDGQGPARGRAPGAAQRRVRARRSTPRATPTARSASAAT